MQRSQKQVSCTFVVAMKSSFGAGHTTGIPASVVVVEVATDVIAEVSTEVAAEVMEGVAAKDAEFSKSQFQDQPCWFYYKFFECIRTKHSHL